MSHIHLGRSEAEILIRTAPVLATSILEQARRDRRRWSTRLFQPARREFLDGFIAVLEDYVATPTQAETPDLGEVMLAVPAAPPEETTTRAVIFPQRDEPAPSPKPAPAGDRSEPVPAPRGTVLARIDPAMERALGVWKMSGWTDEPMPRVGETTVRGSVPPAPQPEYQLPAEAAPLATDWSAVFSQFRGAGMVDLSAYDAIDQLGELGNLLDQWREQNRPLNPVSSSTQR